VEIVVLSVCWLPPGDRYARQVPPPLADLDVDSHFLVEQLAQSE
jgi:hypothetical protein